MSTDYADPPRPLAQAMGGDRFHPSWPLALGTLGCALALLGLLYGETLASMAAIWWRSGTYAHGWLVAPIVCYLIWQRRDNLKALAPTPSPWALGLLVPLVSAWILAQLTSVLVIQQLALVVMVQVVVLAVLGWRIAWAIAFPLGYLLFAVPIGDELVPPLMDFTAYFSVKALQLTGIPVYWEGRLIHIPKGTFEVAEACSGLRYLIASVALGCVYSYLNYDSPWRRLAFIALAVVFPIIGNGLRAYGIIMLAHWSDMQLAVGVDHLIYGWLFFGLLIALMFWLGHFWREDAPASPPAPGASGGRNGRFGVAGLATAAACGLIVATGPVAELRLQANPDGAVDLVVPRDLPAWAGPLPPHLDWQPTYVGAGASQRHGYQTGSYAVELFVAYYAHQTQGAELVNFNNRLYDGDRWYYLDRRRLSLPGVGEGRVVDELQLQRGDRLQVIWSFYWVAGHPTQSPWEIKLREAWGRLTGSDKGAAVVAVMAEVDAGAYAAAEAALTSFFEVADPALQAALARTQTP
ncbi:MAG: exosortase A [Candidatus Competibacterales bacterium]